MSPVLHFFIHSFIAFRRLLLAAGMKLFLIFYYICMAEFSGQSVGDIFASWGLLKVHTEGANLRQILWLRRSPQGRGTPWFWSNLWFMYSEYWYCCTYLKQKQILNKNKMPWILSQRENPLTNMWWSKSDLWLIFYCDKLFYNLIQVLVRLQTGSLSGIQNVYWSDTIFMVGDNLWEKLKV